MKKVILTKGLPASGKDTWAVGFMEEHQDKYKRINKDMLRSMLDNGMWSGKNEKFILDLRDFLITTSLLQGYSVIVTDTNLHPKHEPRIRELVRIHNENVSPKQEEVVVEIKDFTDVPVEVCIKRDSLRANSVGPRVIMQMHQQYLQKKPSPLPYDVSLKKAIICDIDGTLAILHRSPYDTEKCATDEVNRHLLEVLRSLRDSGHTIILVSGREDKWRYETENWLALHEVPRDWVYMRKTDDKRADQIIKKEIYDAHIKDKYCILGVFDDRPRVVRMWRSVGLQVFQLNDEEF